MLNTQESNFDQKPAKVMAGIVDKTLTAQEAHKHIISEKLENF